MGRWVGIPHRLGVEGGIDDEMLTCLHIEQTGIELSKDVLYRQCQVSGATGKVDPVLRLGRKPRLEPSADAFIDVAVLCPLESDEVNLVVGQTEQGGIGGEKLTVLACGNEQETIVFLVVLFKEQVGGQRLFGVEYVDKCFHFITSMHPWCWVA